MNLSEMIREETVVIDLQAQDKQSAIVELVDKLVGTGAVAVNQRQVVLDAITTRENSHATGVGQGVALPHGSVPMVSEMVSALGFSRKGSDFGAMDERAANLVLLTVVPRNSLQTHVRALPGIARLLNKSDLRERLCGSKDARSVMEILVEEEGGALEAGDILS